MQTVLGANGQIAAELTHYLHDNATHDIRLVSRNPTRSTRQTSSSQPT